MPHLFYNEFRQKYVKIFCGFQKNQYLCRDKIHYKPKLNKMKKIFMMIALMAIPFAMQAQTKFHDVEANEAKGPVKQITTNVMGETQTTSFTEDGKIISGELTDIVYDADGYIKSAKRQMMGQSIEVKCLWENGRLIGQVVNAMGNEMKILNVYDENGVITGTKMDMGGQEIETPYTDMKFDDHGNWISRKISMMGNEMEQTRTIIYY